MKRKINIYSFFIYLILISVTILCIIYSTFKILSIEFNYILVFEIILLSMAYYYFLYRYKYSWFSLILFLIIPKPLYLVKIYKVNILQFKGFVYSLIENQYIVDKYISYFQNLVYLILPIFVLIIFYITVVKNNVLILFLLGSTIFIIYYYISYEDLSKPCILFLLSTLLLYSYNEYIKFKLSNSTEKISIKSNYILRRMVLCILVLIVVSLLSELLSYNSKITSFEWNKEYSFDNWIKRRNTEYTTKTIIKNKFDLTYTGFQQNPKKLGGPVKIDNSIAMRLYINQLKKELHLKGTVKDYYNGYMWLKTDSSLKEYDYNNTQAKNKIDIYPISIITTTAFNVLPSFCIDNQWKYFYVDSDGEMYNPKEVKKGGKYSVYFDQQEYLKESFNDISYPQNYNKDIEKYLKISRTVPKRVYDLTYKITEGYDSPFYKALAIEQFLKQNYEYDINVSNVPANTDFVDYFLFEEKKGYCTYFATAFAIMCRIVNIPTRYVEGFDVPLKNNITGYVDVLNSNAHAWVEVYFDKIGWITFDPTSGHLSVEQYLEGKNEIIKYNENIKNEINNRNSNKLENQKREDLEYNKNDASKKETKINLYFIPFILLIISILYYIKTNNIYRTDEKGIIDLSRKIIKYGKYVNASLKSGETFREFTERFGIKIDFDMNDYINLYEKLIYGGNYTKDDCYKLIKQFKIIKQKVKNKIGPVKFYFFDYLNMFIPNKM